MSNAWPTDDITTTHYDASTDDPSQARAELYNLALKVKAIIGALGDSAGVAGAGSNSDITAMSQLATISHALNFTAAVTSSKAAASGYTRITPNYCQRNDITTPTLLSSGTNTISSPAGAKAVLVHLDSEAWSANSAGIPRQALADVCTDSGLTLAQGTCLARGYEFSAAITQALCTSQLVVPVQLASAGASFYIKVTLDAGGNSFCTYSILGYFD